MNNLKETDQPKNATEAASPVDVIVMPFIDFLTYRHGRGKDGDTATAENGKQFVTFCVSWVERKNIAADVHYRLRAAAFQIFAEEIEAYLQKEDSIVYWRRFPVCEQAEGKWHWTARLVA